MSFEVGDAVEVRGDPSDPPMVGRICRVVGGGDYKVQFGDWCLLMNESVLEASERPDAAAECQGDCAG